MNASARCQLLGKWRIIEADTWDCDYLDLVQPAYIVFGKNGRGEFAFSAIEATLELEYAPRIVFFNWTGFDEGDEVSGSGSAELTEDDDTILENRAILPQWRRCRLEGVPILTFSTAC